MATLAITPRTNLFTVATASAGPFPIGFRLFAEDALEIYVDGARNEAFTVTAAFVSGYDDNATITFDVEQASGVSVQIDGDFHPQRQADYLNTDPSLTRKINIELAQQWSAISELRTKLLRTVRVFGTIDPLSLESGKAIIFTDDGVRAGPSALEIENAESNAASAALNAASATASAASISSIPAIIDQIADGTYSSFAIGFAVDERQIDLYIGGAPISPEFYTAVVAVDGLSTTVTWLGYDGSGPTLIASGLRIYARATIRSTVDLSKSGYDTRAAFVSAVALGLTAVDGTVVTAGGLSYVAQAGAAELNGLPGWVPFGDAFPEHNGVDPATNTWTKAAPAIVHRGVPEYLTPELYLGLETQLVYAPGQGSPGEYTGATDFGPAFNAMREELLSIGVASQWPAGTNFPASLALRPGHRYITTTPIPLQDIISTGLLFDGQGATVVGRFDSNRAVLDMLGSQLLSVQNLRIETDSDLRPAIGVLMGRTSGATAERNDLSRVTVHGWFGQAGVYNYASEILTADRVTVYQYEPNVPAVLLDCMNTLNVATLSPATNTNVVGTGRSMNESLWLSLDARCVQGSQTGVVKMISGYRALSDNILHRHKFVNSYVAQNNSTPGSTADRPAFFMKGDTVGIDIDCHVEPYVDNAQIRISHNILFDTASGPMYVSDFRLHDHLSDAQKAVIDTNDVANALSIWNAEIDIPRTRGRDTSNVEARLFGPNMTNATVHGVIKTGLGSALNNFNNLADFKGVLRTEAARSAVTLLPAHAVKMVTSDANSEREQLSILSYTTPDAAVVAVAGADVILVSGGGVSSIAGFSDVSQVRSFRVVNGRSVSITINGLAGTTSRNVPAGQGLTIFQNGGTFYAI